MRQGLMGAVVAALLAGAVWAQEALPPNDGIESTIQSQIDAFLQDDFATAFTFASPGIQSMFRTPENFGAMVRNGYPMVWRPSDVQFGALREEGGGLWQRVIVTDAEGRMHALDYRMVEGSDGWRIAGVTIAELPGLSA